ncbi:unnamed protein product [Lactuca virosa]|uniref:Uncharacterized protein n=1 Tax=Lactuca virosa TaxID=75947 RepID=A0AAU9PF87_9ASTR|nr:unnamed protein product [Lactuca virosa]
MDSAMNPSVPESTAPTAPSPTKKHVKVEIGNGGPPSSSTRATLRKLSSKRKVGEELIELQLPRVQNLQPCQMKRASTKFVPS